MKVTAYCLILATDILFTVGDRVEIASGKFKGQRGEVIEDETKTKKKQVQIKLDNRKLDDLLEEATGVESKTGLENVDLSKLEKGKPDQPFFSIPYTISSSSFMLVWPPIEAAQATENLQSSVRKLASSKFTSVKTKAANLVQLLDASTTSEKPKKKSGFAKIGGRGKKAKKASKTAMLQLDGADDKIYR